MAIYGSLLIDAGGGVIDHNKQSDRQPGASVIIGLGGTGSDAVIKLKKEVYKQLKPDDVGAVIPRYNDIKYLIIDSDDSKISVSNGKISDIDGTTEFFSIANKSIKATFAATEVMKNRRDLDWLDYEHISIDDASKGAGGIRQVGRFLLVDQAEKIYAKIKSTMQSALVGSSGKLTVHICAGISGGTGSGTFLDICYLVRQAVKELGVDASVCGYFFLPDVNLSVPAISADSLKSGYVAVNGFAALKELDYCMNFGKNKDSFKMNYGFKMIDDRQKPVDLCYLISTTNEQGKMISDGYNYAMGVVTDYIINFMAKVKLPDGVETDTEGITLEGHISNLNTIRDGIKLQHGANVEYNILGASVAVMPLSEIATYLGFKLFESYRDMFDRMPTEQERDAFLQATQLKYDDIRKALSKGCAPQINFPQRYDAKLFKERNNGQFVDFAENEYLGKNKGVLEKNSLAFMAAMKYYTIPDDSTSLISRTYKGLCEKYVTNLDYGPFFAQRMLYGTQNKNLIHEVDGFIAQNQNNLEAELRQAQRRDEEYEDALARMQSASFLNEKGRMSDYLNALNNLYVHHYKVELFQTMNTVLQDYKQQLIRLNNNFFSVLTTVLDTLQKTFQENGRVLTQGVRTENNYCWKILSVPDIQKSLDAEAGKLDLQQTLDKLMTTMMQNCAKWVNEDENEITKLISDFILDAFRNATQKTITDYLKEKFQVDNIQLLEQRIEDEIIRNKLGVDSTPLFWKNPMYQNAVGMNSTLTVPYDSTEIKQAAHAYADKQAEYLVRESSITDKISMMRFYSGLPMYAYQGILELQDQYERDNKPGRHLYERGELDWNKWLPSPVPASFKVGMPIARIENKYNTLIAEFEKAEEVGVVVKDELGNWEIMVTEAFDADAFIAAAGGYEADGKIDRKKLNALIAQLEAEAEKQKSGAKHQRIESLKANSGSERQVMLDFYLESPVLNKALHEELEKRQAIKAKIEELILIRDSEDSKVKEQNDFFNAIFTGVLFYGSIVTYTYDEFGIEKVVELQNNEMPMGDTGAYQAYMNFKTMDANIKNKIVAETMKRTKNINGVFPEEIKAIVEKLDANMAKRIARYNMLHDETDPLHEELNKFYTDFMNAFQIFKLQEES